MLAPPRIRSRVVVAALALLRALVGAPDAARADPVAEALAPIVREARHPWLRRPGFASQQGALERLYQARSWAPLWLAGARPTPQAAEAIAALEEAGARGLDPADYDSERLELARRALGAREPAPPGELARFEAALSVALLRYLTHLHVGRLDPQSVTFGLDAERHRIDLATRLPAAVQQGRVRELIAEVDPDYEMVRRLERALGEYRALAGNPFLRAPSFVETLHPGDPTPAAGELARYLTALRDLPAGAARDDGRYTGALAAAIERFQARHGIDPDGVIGPVTKRALAVPPADRARQIELSLERFRWIPDLPAGRLLIVNVPAFELVARESLAAPGAPALAMNVVVGRAGRTPTPVFIAALRSIVFRPYWNVPPSITRNEMLPKIRRDPAYLVREQLEIVASAGGRVLPATPESLQQLAAGGARLRQRPGPDNALGNVKFLFPNRYSVYMHDTPGREIFRKSRRDFSHGCIRVEDPLGLAAWVLRDRPEWDVEAIRAAMAGQDEQRVALRDPILVIVFYTTVIVRADGTVAFFDDLYGYDAALARALAAGEPSRR